MSSSCILPVINFTEVEHCLEEQFGVSGTVVQLAGERDLNYLITAEDQQWVFKVANAEESADFLLMQADILQLIAAQKVFSADGSYVKNRQGGWLGELITDAGQKHYCRLVKFVAGRLYSSLSNPCDELHQDIGQSLGRFARVLGDYQHPCLTRPLLWRLDTALDFVGTMLDSTINADIQTTTANEAQVNNQQVLTRLFAQIKARIEPLQSEFIIGTIHNDANDNNIIVADDVLAPKVISIIDLGDMVRSWRVADPAIAIAYGLLDADHPLTVAASIAAGYHEANRLNDHELDGVFDLALLRLCQSVCVAHQQSQLQPDNDYLTISTQSAWRVLRWASTINLNFARGVIRQRCGVMARATTTSLHSYLSQGNLPSKPVLQGYAMNAQTRVLDCSVAAGAELAVDNMQGAAMGCDSISIGRYDEYRLAYEQGGFFDDDNQQRTLHLGIDVFAAENSVVCAALAGEIHSIANYPERYDYGGVLILRHQFNDQQDDSTFFYTLYGHLAPTSIEHWQVDDNVEAGTSIAKLGGSTVNGRWPAHLHFQIINDELSGMDTYAGVGSAVHREVWLELCPDPSSLLGLSSAACRAQHPSTQGLLTKRQQHLSSALSLSYNQPIQMVRGEGQYLIDYYGKRYLDMVNNVPHVGHCHPAVVKAANHQTALLNTNTRYLHPAIVDYAQALTSTMPDQLSVCFFTNSGSEANDLALRLTQNYKQRRDVIILDHAYHGNLSSLIDISPYKYNGKGGLGQADHVHCLPVPDPYRNGFAADDSAAVAAQFAELEPLLAAQGDNIAAFFAESILGCAGQIVLPSGYLKAVYEQLRAHNILCVADEVQVGFGRCGEAMWAFTTQDVTPDIVTLGKPIANGHPMGAVVTTPEIAETFVTGMEYFNTFGGNPVSCRIAASVLDVLEQENLQDNARQQGSYLLCALQALQKDFPIMGDVRGMGLFIGIEMVLHPQTKLPAPQQTSYVVDRLKQAGFLLSSDGPYHNVVKIKPPMCITRCNIDNFLLHFKRILAEDAAQPSACFQQ